MAVLPTTYERRWPGVILTPIAIANHIITVSSTHGLHTKQKVTLRLGANALTDIEIKRVLSGTEIQVGPLGAEMGSIINPVGFNGGTLEMQEQERNKVGNEITFRAVYEEEPAVALRNVLVDRLGAFYSTDNPLPVQLSDGSINIGTVNAQLEMFITHRDNFPHPGDVHSSLRIGDGNAEATVSEFDEIDAVGLDTVRLNTMVRVAYDDVEVTAYTVDGDVQQITFRSNTEDVAVINVTYNADGDFQRAKVTYV